MCSGSDNLEKGIEKVSDAVSMDSMLSAKEGHNERLAGRRRLALKCDVGLKGRSK